jgi:chromosome segregation ATPase
MLMVAVIAGAAVFAVKSARNGHIHLPAKVQAEVSRLHDWAEGNDSIERKIAKLRKEAGYMTRDLEGTRSKLAEAIVNARETNRDVIALRDTITKEHKDLVARGEALKDGTEKVSTRGLTLAEAKDQLRTDVTRHLDRKRQLELAEKTLATQERIKTSLENQLDTLKRKQGEVKTQIDAAEAKLHELRLAQMESKYQSDDTRLAKIKAELRELNKALDVKAEELKLAPAVYEEGKVSGKSESVEEIMAPLTGEKKAGEKAADKAIE